MYFSILPLLLLFASTICASPVYIGRRTGSISDIPIHVHDRNHENNGVFKEWHQQVHLGTEAFGEVRGARTIKRVDDKGPILLRITMDPTADSKPISTMIGELKSGKKLFGWGWNEIAMKRTAIVVKMASTGEQIAKTCLSNSPTHSDAEGTGEPSSE